MVSFNEKAEMTFRGLALTGKLTDSLRDWVSLLIVVLAGAEVGA